MSLSRDSWDSVQLLTLCTRRSFSESRSVLLIPRMRINETIQWMPCQAKFLTHNTCPVDIAAMSLFYQLLSIYH